MHKCKICSSPTKKDTQTYCSNHCKFSDKGYNQPKTPRIKNDITKRLICKCCGWTSKDINNLSGNPTIHLSHQHHIIDKNYLSHFTIIKIPPPVKFSCKICKHWDTVDVHNKSGRYTKHLKDSHNLSIDSYCKLHPEDKYLWQQHFKQNKYTEFLQTNPQNRIQCLACLEEGKTFVCKKISNSHLKHKHNITPSEYKNTYGVIKTTSDTTTHKQSRLGLDRMIDILFNDPTRLGTIVPLFKREDYTGTDRDMKYEFQCSQCELVFLDHLASQTPICRNCTPKIPFKTNRKLQLDVYDFIKSIYPNPILANDRKELGGKELDIFIPDLKIGIEINGVYWHTDQYKDKFYHYEKSKIATTKGIKLYHIFEDEWEDKTELVKAKIKHLLNRSDSEIIYARLCTISIITSKEKNEFLNRYHIQGADNSSHYLGAYYNNKLIAVMTFGKGRIIYGNKNASTELIRFATDFNYRIPGIGGKLLQFYIQNFTPTEITTHADKRWTPSADTSLYSKLGFQLITESSPNYWYSVKGKRVHRFKYRKSELIKQGHDPLLSEREIMRKLNIYRIWDCGTYTFKMVITKKK